MSEEIKCPKCGSEYTYPQDNLTVCSMCFHEWNQEELQEEQDKEGKVFDVNGTELQNGDAVIVIKDLPVKGAPKPVKAGTKVTRIRLNPGEDHDISCKIDTFGAMGLKSEFVRKA